MTSAAVGVSSGRAHHFAARLQCQGQHPNVYVQLVAQAAEFGRRFARVPGARLVAEHHPQPLEHPEDGSQQFYAIDTFRHMSCRRCQPTIALLARDTFGSYTKGSAGRDDMGTTISDTASLLRICMQTNSAQSSGQQKRQLLGLQGLRCGP